MLRNYPSTWIYTRLVDKSSSKDIIVSLTYLDAKLLLDVTYPTLKSDNSEQTFAMYKTVKPKIIVYNSFKLLMAFGALISLLP